MSIQTLRLSGLLSFAPDSAPLDLLDLNVLIGPNGSGKSNLIEAIELLAAMPRDLAATRANGSGKAKAAARPRSTRHWRGRRRDDRCATASGSTPCRAALRSLTRPLRKPTRSRAWQAPTCSSIDFRKAIRRLRLPAAHRAVSNERTFGPISLSSHNGRDPDLYPEVTWVGERLGAFHTFREWSFGRYVALRRPQPADLPEDRLLADSRNLALVLNQIEHDGGRERLDGLVRRFYPRFERLSTRISGGTVQFYLHERGFGAPIPATRLSDGTIRFVALAAALLAHDPPPLLCIEEPELGLHPDALPLLGQLLVEASVRTLLIVTTHSDALVSALTDHVDAVVACERLGDGTVLRRLDPNQLAAWLDEYRLGDLWRMGELGANP